MTHTGNAKTVMDVLTYNGVMPVNDLDYDGLSTQLETILTTQSNNDDSDGDGNPLGVKTTFECLSSGSGTLTIILRHEPDKKAQGVREGNPANAGGETDIQVTFSFEIKE